MKKLIVLFLFTASTSYAADVTITIPDQYATRVLNAFSYGYGYQDTIDGKPNPETKAAELGL